MMITFMESSENFNRLYSADVRMKLRLNGYVIPVDQLGPGFFISHQAVNHPPAIGEMMLSIDGRERRWLVDLFEGLSSNSPRTQYTSPVSGSLS